jgi:hypothetical protein
MQSNCGQIIEVQVIEHVEQLKHTKRIHGHHGHFTRHQLEDSPASLRSHESAREETRHLDGTVQHQIRHLLRG